MFSDNTIYLKWGILNVPLCSIFVPFFYLIMELVHFAHLISRSWTPFWGFLTFDLDEWVDLLCSRLEFDTIAIAKLRKVFPNNLAP